MYTIHSRSHYVTVVFIMFMHVNQITGNADTELAGSVQFGVPLKSLNAPKGLPWLTAESNRS